MGRKASQDWELVFQKIEGLVKSGDIEPSWDALSKRLAIPRTSIQNEGAKRGIYAKTLMEWRGLNVGKIATAELGINFQEIDLTSPRITTLEQLLRAGDVDKKIWDVERHWLNKWEVGAKDLEGKLHIAPLFQVKAILRRIHLKRLFPHIVPLEVKIPPLKIPKTTKTAKATAKTGVQRALVISDAHIGFRRDIINPMTSRPMVPFHDRRVLHLALQLAKEQEFDHILFTGDELDLTEWSTHWLVEPESLYTTMPAIIELSYWLAQFRMAAPNAKIALLQGNHDRFETAVMTNLKPAHGLRPVDELELPPTFSMQRLLALHTLQVGFVSDYPNGEYWLSPDLMAFHGDVAASGFGATAAKYVQRNTFSVIYGHVHRIETVTRTIRSFDREYMIQAMCFGCACYLDGRVPGSEKHPARQWQNGIGVVEFEDGAHTAHAVPIRDGRMIFNGARYEAPADLDETLTEFLRAQLDKIAR